MPRNRPSAIAALVAVLFVGGCADSITSVEQTSSTAEPSLQVSTGAVAVNGNIVAQYARTHVYTMYVSSGGSNPFCDFQWMGGNCTNFASQAILAGLVGSTDPTTVFNRRRDFQTDRYITGYQWYYESCGIRGSAWAGAHELYTYARYNRPTYRGLHFTLVTYDTPTAFMDYTRVRAGDIIFADWTNDGRFDHTMIVTQYDDRPWYLTSNSGYNRVRVAYQNGENYPAAHDAGLGDINIRHNYKAVFHVYRPVDYNPSGL